MKFRMLGALLAGLFVCSLLSGCICDGHETSFKEVDRKYAESTGAFIVAYVPVIGWIAYPFLAITKHQDYVAVLLRKPSTPEYELLRWDNRFIISPIAEDGKTMYY